MLDAAKNFVAEKVANIPKPTAEVTDVDLKDISRDSFTLHAKISVTNPYSTAIPICEISYSLKSAEREIASGKIPDPGSIAASTVTILDVPVKVPYTILISLVRDMATDWDIDYELKVGLIIDLPLVGNLTLPLSYKGEMKLPSIRDMLPF